MTRTFNVLRPAEVMARTGLGNTAMHEAEADGLLPQFFKINGGRASGVFEHELDEILEARAGDATDDEVRPLVRRQLEHRKKRFDELRAA